MRHQVNLKVWLTVAIFFVLAWLRYAPVMYKGASPMADFDNLTLAKNYAATGRFSLEDRQNVVLTTDEVINNGQVAKVGNTLTPFLSAAVFKIFGFDPYLPVQVSVVLFALSSALIFLLIYRLFGWWPALLAGAMDLFLPAVWLGSIWAGAYEWATVFFILALLVYFWRSQATFVSLLLASILLGASLVSRNAFLLSMPALFIYDYLSYKKIKRLLMLAAPLFLIFGLWLYPGYLSPSQSNSYLTKEDTDFGRFGHLFNDPYTYHYERESFLSAIQSDKDHDTLDFLIKYGYPVSLMDRVSVYLYSAKFYFLELFKLTNFGGPLIVLLMFLGLFWLWSTDRKLAMTLSAWLIIWYLALIYLRTNNWDHYLEVRWPLLTLAALGAVVILNKLKEFFAGRIFVRYVGAALALFLALQMFASAQWAFHQRYETSRLAELNQLTDILNRQQLAKQEIVAIGSPTFRGVHYYTDQSLVFFQPATLAKLAQENRLAWALEKFGVKYAAGYDASINQAITAQTQVKVLE